MGSGWRKKELVRGREARCSRGGEGTHVLQHGLHKGDSDLGLLDEVVLGVLDLETGVFLLCGACTLEPKIQGGALVTMKDNRQT
jgi:hypothetical protein